MILMRRNPTDSAMRFVQCTTDSHWWPCEHFPDQASVDAWRTSLEAEIREERRIAERALVQRRRSRHL